MKDIDKLKDIQYVLNSRNRAVADLCDEFFRVKPLSNGDDEIFFKNHEIIAAQAIEDIKEIINKSWSSL